MKKKCVYNFQIFCKLCFIFKKCTNFGYYVQIIFVKFSKIIFKNYTDSCKFCKLFTSFSKFVNN